MAYGAGSKYTKAGTQMLVLFFGSGGLYHIVG
jgi:hypothetical protein